MYCSSCGKEIHNYSIYCTWCGSKTVQRESFKTKCNCGIEFADNKKFCTVCGVKNPNYNKSFSEQAEKNKIVYCTSCGKEQPADKKFCSICGKNLLKKTNTDLQHFDKSQNSHSFSAKTRKTIKRSSIIITSSFIIAIGLILYFTFIYKPPIKKTLLTSIAIEPNDTSETVLKYNNELTLIIPKGQIKSKDTLDLYDVENIDKPDFADGIAKTYDFDFKKTTKFSEPVTVEISYAEQVNNGTLSSDQTMFVMYYNEENNQWEDVDVFDDPEEQKLIFYTTHFSDYGTLYAKNFSGGLMMKIRSMRRPSRLKSIPTIEDSQQILETYSNLQTPGDNAFRAGMDMASEAFGLTSTFTGFTEEVVGLPIFEKFNAYAGELGIMFSLYQFGTEIYDGKNDQAVLNLSKNLLSYALGKWGWQGLRIANIGIFIIDYTLTKAGTAVHETAEQYWTDKYNSFNAKQNKYRKDKEGWKKFIVTCFDNGLHFKEELDAEIHRYLREFSNDPELGLMPERYEETLMAQEKVRVYEILKLAIDDAHEEINQKREREIIEKFRALKNLLNNTAQIMVIVYGEEAESKKVRGLPVRIIVEKDKELWQGSTDDAGQFTLNFTWLAYLYYGKPTVVEVIYNDRVMRQSFSFETTNNCQVRFYIDKDEEQTNSLFPSDLAGIYSGVIEITKGKGANEGKKTSTIFSENIDTNIDQLQNFDIPLVEEVTTIDNVTIRTLTGSVFNINSNINVEVNHSGELEITIIYTSQVGFILNDLDNDDTDSEIREANVCIITGSGKFVNNGELRYTTKIKANCKRSYWSYSVTKYNPEGKEEKGNKIIECEIQLYFENNNIIGTMNSPLSINKNKSDTWKFEAKK